MLALSYQEKKPSYDHIEIVNPVTCSVGCVTSPPPPPSEKRKNSYSVVPTRTFTPLRKHSNESINSDISDAESTGSGLAAKPKFVTVKSLIPTHFDDMYAPEIMQDPTMLTSQGRPLFSKRALIDWVKNDLRSLLIVDKLRPEWNGIIPTVIEPGFHVLYLPLDATDQQIIHTLVTSDIYKEHGFDEKFLIQTAQYTVEAARQRHEALKCSQAEAAGSQTNTTSNLLSKPEWRNIIENYLLNLGCEAQCRLDFKKSCSYLKRKKQEEAGLGGSQSRSTSPTTSPTLLKRALLTSSATSPDFPNYLKQQQKPKSSISRAEKQQIWVQVQADLYRRLGLNWEPDELI